MTTVPGQVSSGVAVSYSQGQDTAAERRLALGRRLAVTSTVGAVVALALGCALVGGPLLFAALIVAVYLGLRLVLRLVLERHDAPLWAPLAADTRAGRIDERLLDQTLPGLLHPGRRTAVAVALAHLRADRHEWEGVRRCGVRMGSLCRTVVRRSLDESEDNDRVFLGVRILARRALLGRVGGMGSPLPSDALFCVMAILHGRGLYRRAFAVGRRAWRAVPQPQTAYGCGCALARLGDNAEAIRWLGVAVAAGYPARDMASDDDLVGLRHLPDYEALACSLD